jgi:P-type E1-E2 ATPase
LARGILAAAEARELALPAVRDFRALPGLGVEGRVGGQAVWIGSPRGAVDRGVPREVVEGLVQPLEKSGESAVIVQIDGRTAAAFGLSDELRATSAAAIRALRDMGLDVLVLSGDRRAAVERLRAALTLERVASELSPEAKVLQLSTLRASGRRVAMVGDGMNDAPALAAAFTGMAFGGGADVAVQTAGTTILRDDPQAVPAAVRLARATVRTIRQNLAWAFAYNLFAIPVATGVFDRWLGGALPSGLAGAAMSFSSLAVVLNSFRLRNNC